MAEEGREIPQEYDLSLGSKETEIPLNKDVSMSPTKKRERTTTAATYLFGVIISQESSSLESKETALPLADDPMKKRSRIRMKELARKIKERCLLSNEEREEEERTGASTQLSISLTQTKNMVQDSREIAKESSFSEPKETGVRLFGVTIWERGQTSMTRGQWTIEKTLMQSDVNGLSRLMIKKDDVESHIMTYLSPDLRAKSQEEDGVKVKVRDEDTGTVHDVVFKRWGSSGSYVLNCGWMKEFVRRRKLKQGDKIGFYWGIYDSRLHFSVLSRPPPADKNSEEEP